MDWNDLDALCCVIERGGFTAAADVLGRPKSSISASVARLEAQLGARLLQRTTRCVRATEAGENLYQEAGPVFHRLREVREGAAARCEAVNGTLRIAAPYEFGAHHLGAVACSMLARYPELHVEIGVEHGVVDPLARGYDIVFSNYDIEHLDSGRVVRSVIALKCGIFAAPRLLERYPKVKCPADLAELPMIASPLDEEWRFSSGSESYSIPIRARMRSPNADVRRRAALEGLGVSRTTSTFSQDYVAAGRLVELLPDYTCAPLRIYALLPGGRLLPQKVRIFLSALGARFERA
ncbi:MAG: HTH-type transcriptional regulator DmlR [Burkholderiaceae bacterium]|nr:HTH-type transcriptional regulator DmlR [Burkholderiaceae bacterium]